MAYSYHVQYRVDRSVRECEQRVLELLSIIKSRTAITGRLLKKRAEPFSWMEVYENVRDDALFELALENAASQLSIRRYLEPGSRRRLECFET
ncbi:MAG TPA: DUF4936 family protein [Burkholderiales bacterium]|jgi:hypothetical protein|nr:DUF4936 family protein [Burkholderiales bacterium]